MLRVNLCNMIYQVCFDMKIPVVKQQSIKVDIKHTSNVTPKYEPETFLKLKFWPKRIAVPPFPFPNLALRSRLKVACLDTLPILTSPSLVPFRSLLPTKYVLASGKSQGVPQFHGWLLRRLPFQIPASGLLPAGFRSICNSIISYHACFIPRLSLCDPALLEIFKTVFPSNFLPGDPLPAGFRSFETKRLARTRHKKLHLSGLNISQPR